ncbi:hypothetical protein PLEOSDRAFT_1085824 [Pleurotus ostreatus PC15]|uniref:Ricin B lectin domain-containing protein n=1 Tax=Pleurotus ostreatus (strain PC15) TaxID=1137138 RepID=A0A067N9M9_PLEO1|nr:hypothetical protein PLEOSDRAFT_1085824 [Pleurotus ostreatus PC15]
MLSVSAVLYLTSILSGVTLATPSANRRDSHEICTPNFEADAPYDWNNSEAVGLLNGVAVGSALIKRSPAAFFKFTKISSTPPSFTVHAFDNPELAVGLSSNKSLTLTSSHGDEYADTKFLIECTFCGSAVQDNCFMKLAEYPDHCVQVGNAKDAAGNPTRGGSGDPLFVTSPCRKDDSQRFNYFKKDLPPSPPPTLETPSTPPSGQVVCNPNFEFEGVRVANSAVNWGAPAFVDNTDLLAESDFNKRLEIRFEQTGHPNPYYIAKSLNGSNLVVATRAVNDNLYFIPADEQNEYVPSRVSSLTSPNTVVVVSRTKFLIECVSGCQGAGQVPPGSLSADGCTIKSQFNGKCVQIGNGPQAGSNGDRIFLNNCDATDSQRFNFITSPFKRTGIDVNFNSDVAPSSDVKVHLAGNEDGGELDVDLKELIRNSYIALGLLAGVLVGMIVFGVMMLARGCMKGRDSKPRYTVVAGKNDVEAFTAPSGRYSD